MNRTWLKQKKVFITGGRGFVGKHLVRVLSSAGALVETCLVDLLKDDVSSRGRQRPDYIFHLAARSPAATDQINAAKLWRDNLAMTENVLGFAAISGAALIVASSSHVYPPQSVRVGHPWREDEAVEGRTVSAFGLSKQAVEKICLEKAKKHGFKVVIARLTNIYGPGDESQRLIPTFIRQCLKRQLPLELMGPEEDVRDFIHIDDAVAGLLSIGAARQGEIINIGSGRPRSIGVMIEVIKEEAGLAGEPVRYQKSRSAGDASYNVLDITKAGQLGFAPAVPFRDGIRDTMAWWRAPGR